MNKDRKDRTVIAHVEVGTFPGGTLREWLAWREAEDQRMMREVGEQIVATLQLQEGATRH